MSILRSATEPFGASESFTLKLRLIARTTPGCVPAVQMSLASATEAPTGIEPGAEEASVDEDDNVLFVFEGADAFILDESGMHRVTEQALQRSPVLSELKDAPGSSTLPVSKRVFRMWLDLVATGADCSAWTDDADLCRIAQVKASCCNCARAFARPAGLHQPSELFASCRWQSS